MPTSLGPAEILVILVVALIVLGPKRLPEAGRQVGKALSEVRRWSRDVKREIATTIEPGPEPVLPPPAAPPPPMVADPEPGDARPVAPPAPPPVPPTAGAARS